MVSRMINLVFVTILFVFARVIPVDNVALALDCYSTPNDGRCTSFTMSNDELTRIVSSVCEKNPYLPACYLESRCRAYKPWVKDVCQLSRIVSYICADMPNVIECESYLSLCRGNSVVAQCFNLRRISNFISFMEAESSVEYLCDKLNTDECDECTNETGSILPKDNCNYINVWFKLCQTSKSKDMHPCTGLAIRCDEYKNYYGNVVSEMCNGNQTELLYENKIVPEAFSMFSKPYLHFSTKGYFLLKYFFIDSKIKLLLAMSSSVLLGSMFMKVLKLLSSRCEYLLPDPDVNSEYEISELVSHAQSLWGLNLVKKLLSAIKLSSKFPNLIIRILGIIFESVMLVSLISIFITVFASGNLTFIIPVALGVCISYF